MNYKPLKPWWTVYFSFTLLFFICSFYSLHISSQARELREERDRNILASGPILAQLEQDFAPVEAEFDEAKRLGDELTPQKLKEEKGPRIKELRSRLDSLNSLWDNKAEQIVRLEKRASRFSILGLVGVFGSLIAVFRVLSYQKKAVAEREQVLQNQ